MGGGGWRFKGRLVGALLLNPSIVLTLFKAKCIKIVIPFFNISLFSVLIVKMNTFFKIEVPINLYHAERHISPSEAVWKRRNNADNYKSVLSIFFLSFSVFFFYSTGMMCNM